MVKQLIGIEAGAHRRIAGPAGQHEIEAAVVADENDISGCGPGAPLGAPRHMKPPSNVRGEPPGKIAGLDGRLRA